MKTQINQMNAENNSNIDAVIAGLAGDLTKDVPTQRTAVEQALQAMVEAVDEIKAEAETEPPVIVVEIKGGLVQRAYSSDSSLGPVKVIFHDHDNLSLDPAAQPDEWLLGSEANHA